MQSLTLYLQRLKLKCLPHRTPTLHTDAHFFYASESNVTLVHYFHRCDLPITFPFHQSITNTKTVKQDPYKIQRSCSKGKKKLNHTGIASSTGSTGWRKGNDSGSWRYSFSRVGISAWRSSSGLKTEIEITGIRINLLTRKKNGHALP